MQGLIYDGAVLMMSGWESLVIGIMENGLGEVREGAFLKNDGHPQGGGMPKTFLVYKQSCIGCQ